MLRYVNISCKLNKFCVLTQKPVNKILKKKSHLKLLSTNCKFDYHLMFNSKPPPIMSTFKFLDYDCIGFDLDNTLLRYNITNLVMLEYKTLATYLVHQKNYSSRYLSQPLTNIDLDFMQKGLLLDFEKGNILKISPNGIIQRACHGTKLLSMEEVRNIYPAQRWEITDAFCHDMLSTWNEPLSMKMRALLDYFDIPSSLIFAKAVDTLDEENGKPLGVYNIWPDMLDGLFHMFDKDHFESGIGQFFPTLKQHPEMYLHKCSPQTVSWLKDIKKNRVSFLLTGSNVDFVNFTATYALGEDWTSLFHIVICYAKKPGFFANKRPFLDIINYKESNNVVPPKNLKEGKMYSQGNWKDLVHFLSKLSGTTDPRCLYIGDNLLQDIYAPSIYRRCDTIAIIEEQLSERMVHQELSHPDENILNSTLWGSYFCLKDSATHVESVWGHIIRTCTKICIPDIDFISHNSFEESFECFDKKKDKLNGYYPAIPLSISNLS